MRPKETAHTILIATTNPGKFEEITSEFKDLPFTFVGLKDVKLDHVDLEEPYNTTWENALHKAKYFAKESGLTTIAEDTGIFIDGLNGAPGVKAKRFAATPEEIRKKVLDGLKDVPMKQRTAYFETTGVVADPQGLSIHLFTGRLDGLIAEREVGEVKKGMIYESIFFHPPSGKHFSEMSVAEKNLISHRGQVTTQIKFFLQKQFGFKQIPVPLALVVKDGKLLMLKRRDSRSEFNNKWEFPGGGVEKGESVEECIHREVFEETGFTVSIKEQIPKILTHYEAKWNYQVFLMAFICTVEQGKLQLQSNENSGSGWFTLEDAIKEELLPLNKQLLEENYDTLKKYFR